jgi:hypothetical protein
MTDLPTGGQVAIMPARVPTFGVGAPVSRGMFTVPTVGATGAIGATGVRGPQGIPGTSGGVLVFAEIPAGVQNGINTNFTLAHIPVIGSTAVYRNGLREFYGVGYTLSGATLVFSAPPLFSDTVTIDYAVGG